MLARGVTAEAEAAVALGVAAGGASVLLTAGVPVEDVAEDRPEAGVAPGLTDTDGLAGDVRERVGLTGDAPTADRLPPVLAPEMEDRGVMEGRGAATEGRAAEAGRTTVGLAGFSGLVLLALVDIRGAVAGGCVRLAEVALVPVNDLCIAGVLGVGCTEAEEGRGYWGRSGSFVAMRSSSSPSSYWPA